MIFRRKKDIEKHAKKVDKLVTGLIIWGAIASIIGLWKNTDTGKQVQHTVEKEGKKIAKTWYRLFGKALVGIISSFTKK